MLENTVLRDYIDSLCRNVAEEYTIDPHYYNSTIKRGLRNEDGTGVLAGVTRIGSVMGYYIEDGERMPMNGKLYYRGIQVSDIVTAHQETRTFGFEEVAYLLLLGKLPTREQLQQFNAILASARILPPGFFEDMILKVSSSNIMNMLSRCVLALYTYDPNPEDNSIENLMRQSIELIGRFPSIVATAYAVKRHHYDNKSLYIHSPKEDLSMSENFLRMVREDKSYQPEEALLLDLMMIIHAEHGAGNNSTFTCRSLSSTGTDTYSAIAGAVSALKGPLHGGANAKVVEMFNDIKANVSDWTSEGELNDYLARILDGKTGDGSGKIYGLGHAIYTMSDPRAEMIKKYARSLAEKKGCGEEFNLLENIERLGVAQISARKHNDIPLCANVDLYSGLVYRMLGIPVELYTPLFALARVAGWCAHRIEEVHTCNRIIRPAYRAAFVKQPYVPIDER